MNRNPSPEELLKNSNYELMHEIEYSNLKPFILKEIGKKSTLIVIYSILQVIAMVILAGLFLLFLYELIRNGIYKIELITFFFSIIFSFTLLIPIHELLHAAAFLVLGKKDIGFGVQWKKFLFYAESNRQVLNRNEITVVASAPFLTIFIAGISCFIFSPSNVVSLSGLVIVLLHFMFCGGDFAIISLFYRYKLLEIYTFDDRKERKSYYFKRII